MKLLKSSVLFSFSVLSFSLQAQTPAFERNLDIEVEKNNVLLSNPWVGGMNSMQFSKVDLNLDGIEDLFCFDRTSFKTTTYINTGSPGNNSYSYAPEYESRFPRMQHWALLVDYNMDNKRDLFTYTPGGITIYKNISTPTDGLKFEELYLHQYGYLPSVQDNDTPNIYVGAIDIPAIVDVDNDGDIDVIAYGNLDNQLDYNKNLSQETYGHSDSLNFELYNQCWGNFTEDASNCTTYLLDTCSNSGLTSNNPQLDGPGELRSGAHTGSSVLALDMTGDGVKEILMGDISCTQLVGLYNDGPTVNSASSMISQDVTFPSYDVPVDLWLFPAGFYEDIDNDGVRDLLVSPNSYNQSEDVNSVWLYRNTGNDSVPDFSYVQDNFLQNDMIEVGTGSVPQYFDYDGDGLKDLFVANLGRFDRMSNDYIPSITLYQNVGHDTLPAFKWITDDYAGISTMGFGSAVVPDFADLDGDGDADMMVGDGAGQLHYFENNAAIGSPANFILSTPYYQDVTMTAIDVGDNAIPRLIDLDRDGDFDMVVGKKTGMLSYFENVGTTTNPLFEEQTSSLGGVNVKTIYDPGGYSCPTFYDHNGVYELLVGSNSGSLYHYDSIENNIFGSFRLIDSMAYQLYSGYRSTPCLVELTDDTLPELIMGNFGGGLWFFEGVIEDTSGINIVENPLEKIDIYPNPAKDRIIINSGSYQGHANYVLMDMTGRRVLQGEMDERVTTIPLQGLSSGSYILRLDDGQFQSGKKLVIQP